MSVARCVYGLMCPRPAVSKARCSHGPMCQRPAVSTGRCVQGPLCPRPVLSTARCVQGPLCSTPAMSKVRCVRGPLCPRPARVKDTEGRGHSGSWTLAVWTLIQELPRTQTTQKAETIDRTPTSGRAYSDSACEWDTDSTGKQTHVHLRILYG